MHSTFLPGRFWPDGRERIHGSQRSGPWSFSCSPYHSLMSLMKTTLPHRLDTGSLRFVRLPVIRLSSMLSQVMLVVQLFGNRWCVGIDADGVIRHPCH